MPVIDLNTSITAPIERVFDLARSIDLHLDSAYSTREQAVAGRINGLIGPNEEVSWKGRHFGVWHHLTVRITTFERPSAFTDVMIRGAFQRLVHQHLFKSTADGIAMHDIFTYKSPLGVFGHLADRLFLENYLRSFLLNRNHQIKVIAESNAWKKYL